MSERPGYFAVIPAPVRYSKISSSAKLLYGEISALAEQQGYCYASNGYFAKIYECHNQTISTWIGELVAEKFIRIDAEKGGVQRKIYLLAKGLIPLSRKTQPPMSQNAQHSNKDLNNKDIKYPIVPLDVGYLRSETSGENIPEETPPTPSRKRRPSAKPLMPLEDVCLNDLRAWGNKQIKKFRASQGEEGIDPADFLLIDVAHVLGQCQDKNTGKDCTIATAYTWVRNAIKWKKEETAAVPASVTQPERYSV